MAADVRVISTIIVAAAITHNRCTRGCPGVVDTNNCAGFSPGKTKVLSGTQRLLSTRFRERFAYIRRYTVDPLTGFKYLSTGFYAGFSRSGAFIVSNENCFKHRF